MQSKVCFALLSQAAHREQVKKEAEEGKLAAAEQRLHKQLKEKRCPGRPRKFPVLQPPPPQAAEAAAGRKVTKVASLPHHGNLGCSQVVQGLLASC